MTADWPLQQSRRDEIVEHLKITIDENLERNRGLPKIDPRNAESWVFDQSRCYEQYIRFITNITNGLKGVSTDPKTMRTKEERTTQKAKSSVLASSLQGISSGISTLQFKEKDESSEDSWSDNDTDGAAEPASKAAKKN